MNPTQFDPPKQVFQELNPPVRGRVDDRDGEPKEGIKVVIRRVSYDETLKYDTNEVIAEAVTDDEGEYSISEDEIGETSRDDGYLYEVEPMGEVDA